MTKKFRLGKDALTSEILVALGKTEKPQLAIDTDVKTRIKMFRGLVDKALRSGKTYYGINTGFGLLADVRISPDQLETLQLNLVRSHACGVGARLSQEISRSLFILRLHTFCLGHSGVSLELVEMIFQMLEKNMIPCIPVQGSVGASGDLAPLAHLALPLIGEGEVFYQNKIVDASKALKAAGMKPVKLKAKEGLSLINGTHFMTSIASHCVERAKTLGESANIILGMSLDAMRGTLVAYDSRIHEVRKHPHQAAVASQVRGMFKGKDAIVDSHKDCGKVQDPYSFRCAPQVHGAYFSCLDYVSGIVKTELNSVTDNPLVFENGDILSGGNFHGQYIAQAMDFLAIAVTDLSSMIERRIEKLTNPVMSGLPAFLTKDSGLNSGFMMPHVTAAALCSENKVLAHPASVDSIPTSADKEDHVSMGPAAAMKAMRVLDNTFRILSIEALASAQGIDLLHPLKPSKSLAAVHDGIRKISRYYKEDRSLAKDIEQVAQWIENKGVLTC